MNGLGGPAADPAKASVTDEIRQIVHGHIEDQLAIIEKLKRTR